MRDYIRDPLGDEDTPFSEWSDAINGFLDYDRGRDSYHLASDYNWGAIGEDANQQVYAIANGEVAHIATGYGGFGDAVVLYHTLASGRQFTSVYGHLDSSVTGGPVSYADQLGTLHDWDADHLHFAIAEGHTLGALRGSTDRETRDTRAIGADGVEYVDVPVDSETVRFYDPAGFLAAYLNPVGAAPSDPDTVSGLMLVDSRGGVYRTDVLTRETELLADYSMTFTDIAITPDGRVYANTFNALYELDLDAGTSERIYLMEDMANGLASDSDGRLYIGYLGDDRIDVFDRETGTIGTPIDLPDRTRSAGDIHIVDDRLYYTTSTRDLLTVDLATGAVLNSAYHGLSAAYGLHYVNEQMYAFSGRELYSINAFTGATVELAQLEVEGSIYGAATVPSRTISGSDADDVLVAWFSDLELYGYGGDDRMIGSESVDRMNGGSGNDTLRGNGGDDLIEGGSGADTLNGDEGNDTILGWQAPEGDDLTAGAAAGAAAEDLRDVIYAGAGDDFVDGGYGNDLIYGQGGNDTLAGGFGADELQGQDGNDVITGSAFGDIVFGNAGDDFVNGGFGHDLINGGAGADKFFHAGGDADAILGHGSDWVQDYDAAEGDVLVFGGTAPASDFQVNFTHTASRDTGERSGDDDVEEAFVIYKPTGQILWALVDGGGQGEINLQIGAEVFDLLA
ncbi:MAG: peptidoglycan DD-metalloendopeptidase family protein [Jhaorihella sp.]